MATLQDIKRRIKSVKNTQQITRAMKMVAAAKLRRAQEDVVDARPYAQKMQEVIAALSSKTSPDVHPLLASRGAGKVELLVLTSDRGLCGGFNSNIIRATERFIRESSDYEIGLNLVGKKGMDYFKRGRTPIRKERPFGSGRPDYTVAAGIGRDIINAYTTEEVDEVHIVFGQFKSALSQEPVIRKLLPLAPAKEEGGEVHEPPAECIFEPSEDAILEELLPKYVEGQIFSAFLESSASEHGARMTAMDSASKNAKEMIGALTLQFNRVRQAAITKELMEIISGAEALKG
ncbi:MAG: ATP synthase F1 subunit gamma [Thermodesulfobacteriota bacterium]